jgi:hypothetical protein
MRVYNLINPMYSLRTVAGADNSDFGPLRNHPFYAKSTSPPVVTFDSSLLIMKPLSACDKQLEDMTEEGISIYMLPSPILSLNNIYTDIYHYYVY